MNRIASRVRRTVLALGVALPLAALGAGESLATAMFSSSASAVLTVTGITNLTTPGGGTEGLGIIGGAISIGALAPPGEDLGPFVEGNASGNVGYTLSPEITDLEDVDEGQPFPFPFALGDSLTLMVSADGLADPTGYVDAVGAAIGGIQVTNDSLTDSFEISFSLVFTVMATASFDDPSSEDAYGFAQLLAYEEMGEDATLEHYVEADPLFGIFDPPVSDVLEFSFTVAPEGVNSIAVLAQVEGFAEAIPAPGAAGPLLLGLAVLARLRRRR